MRRRLGGLVAAAALAVVSITTSAGAVASWPQLGADLAGVNPFDYFGSQVALSGDGLRLVVAGYGWDGATPGSSIGVARVFEWNGTGWVQLGSDIEGTNPTPSGFGDAVSISEDGSRVAVGDPTADAGGSNSGQVRIFEWNGTAWAQLGNPINGEAVNDQSGVAVALDPLGSRIAIGAYLNDGSSGSSSDNRGHVRVYEWNGSAWVLLGGDIDGEASGDYSASAVDLANNRVFIGAPGNDGSSGSSSDNRGHVRVYELNGSAWVQLGGDIDGEAAGDGFGASLATSANGVWLVVGASGNDVGGALTNAGHVRVFEYVALWSQVGGDIDGALTNDRFGSSVAISPGGETVAVGAPGASGGAAAGSVSVFENLGSPWTQSGPTIDGASATDSLGSSVALAADGQVVAVGVPLTNNSAGYARVFGFIQAPGTPSTPPVVGPAYTG